MKRGFIRSAFVALVAGCYHPSITPPEQLALEAAVTGWTEVFGEPDARECGLDLTTVIHVDAGRFERVCRTPPARASACLRYESVGLRRSAPRIYLVDTLDESGVVEGVIHESLHNLVECELDRSPWDPFDHWHTDPRVWTAAGGATSAQSRARAIVERGD